LLFQKGSEFFLSQSSAKGGKMLGKQKQLVSTPDLFIGIQNLKKEKIAFYLFS
jgi:hypothetical protein